MTEPSVVRCYRKKPATDLPVPEAGPCSTCGVQLELDLETWRQSRAAGWEPIVLYRCRNGHAWRAPEAEVRPTLTPSKPVRRCAVCGEGIDLRGRGRSVMIHRGTCRRFYDQEWRRWYRTRKDPWILEAQPWYQGNLAERPALDALDPLGGRLPRAWWEGYLRAIGEAA